MLIEGGNGEMYAQCRIPGIVMTEKNTLLAYYECRKSNSDWAQIDLKIIRSTDGGESWQTAGMIAGKGITLNNPVMIVKGDAIHFLFLKGYKNLYHCISRDDGISFTEPKEIRFSCDFFYSVVAVGPGHGIVHNGNLIVPVWFAQNPTDEKAHQPSVIATLYSRDGETWHIGELIGEDILHNPSECALAVTGENKVLISIRNENTCLQRAFAISDDGIGNWQNLHFAPQMPDPICMGSMCHEKGTLYHINCNSQTARENLTVKISTDCFESYESIPVDTSGGYADMAVKDGVLYILHERDFNNGELHFRRLAP